VRRPSAAFYGKLIRKRQKKLAEVIVVEILTEPDELAVHGPVL
jgi:hypothetical protein